MYIFVYIFDIREEGRFHIEVGEGMESAPPAAQRSAAGMEAEKVDLRTSAL